MSCTPATSSNGGNTKGAFQETDAAFHTLRQSPHTKRTLNPVWHLIFGITMGTGTRAGKFEPPPQHSPKCYCPLHHEDHFWPLTALTAPRAPTDSHLSGLQTFGFIDWFGIVLLRLAYLSLQLCLHHKKIISRDYLLFLMCRSSSLFLSLPLSVPLPLFCRFPLHSALLSHDQTPSPTSPCSLSFCFSLSSPFCRLGEEVVNRLWLHLCHCLTVCPFVQALLSQLPIHTDLPISTLFRVREKALDEISYSFCLLKILFNFKSSFLDLCFL